MNFNKILNTRIIAITVVILAAALFRLIPHYPNFTPIAAMALFAGAHMGKRWISFFLPLAALFVSDLFLGFHSFMIPVYFSFMLVVMIGFAVGKNIGIANVLGGSVGASVLFFIITNFAVWAGSAYYPQTFAGLMQSYTMAIPFFHTTLLGDLFFSTLLFGGYYLVSQKYPTLARVTGH